MEHCVTIFCYNNRKLAHDLDASRDSEFDCSRRQWIHGANARNCQDVSSAKVKPCEARTDLKHSTRQRN